MKVGDLVRYEEPVRGAQKWFGLVIEADTSSMIPWLKVLWQDGLQRWEYSHNLESISESRRSG